jgi:hypothetical protein
MRRWLVVPGLSLLAVLVPAAARAWNPQGHMMVAALAYQQLEPAARAKVGSLLRLNPDYPRWVAGVAPADRDRIAFLRAANWADDLREAPGYTDEPQPPRPGYQDHQKHKDWHYINIPFSLDGTAVRPPATPNVKTQIATLRRELAWAPTDDRRSFALVWLLHLVGDVHQPLHTVARFDREQRQGDRGGTWVMLCRLPCKDHLHGFWDSVLGNSGDPQEARAQALRLPAPEAAPAAITDEQRWVDEGVALAKEHVYRAPVGAGEGPYTLDEAYQRNARQVAAARVALAGARLATLINGALR